MSVSSLAGLGDQRDATPLGEPVKQDGQAVSWGRALVSAIPGEVLAAYTAVLGVTAPLATADHPHAYLPFRFAWYVLWIVATPAVVWWSYRRKSAANPATGAPRGVIQPGRRPRPAAEILAATVAAVAWFTAMPGSPWEGLLAKNTFAITSAVATAVGFALLGLIAPQLTTGLGRAATAAAPAEPAVA